MSGGWTLKAVAYPVGTSNGTAGTCRIAFASVMLTPVSQTESLAKYNGEVFNLKLACSGMTPPALLRDTVIDFASEPLVATIGRQTCAFDLVTPCPPPDMRVVAIELCVRGLCLLAHNPSSLSMAGQLSWRDASGAYQLYGSWDATHQAERVFRVRPTDGSGITRTP
jgi:hypothetical protein